MPADGCVFLEICKETTILLMQNDGVSAGFKDQLNACIPREGFHNSDLGIDISYTQSPIDPNVVIVRVAGVEETRLAKWPNLK